MRRFRIVLRIDVAETNRHEDIGEVTCRGKSSAFTAIRALRAHSTAIASS